MRLLLTVAACASALAASAITATKEYVDRKDATNAVAIAAEATRAKAAEKANADAIAAEATRAKKAEASNATAIASEKTRAEKAEAALGASISSVSNTLSSAIAAETTRAKKAEQANATAAADAKKAAADHAARTDNPHKVTASQVGAYTKAQVDAKGYVTKSVTNGLATASALSAETTRAKNAEQANASAISTHKADKKNPHGVTAAQVGAYTKGEVDAKGYVTKTVTNGLATAAALTAETTRAKKAEAANATAAADAKKAATDHAARTDNPHKVTASQVGAYTKGEVDAKGYVTKSVTNGLATASALSAETTRAKNAEQANASAISTHKADKKNPHGVTAAQVGAYTKGEVDAKGYVTKTVTNGLATAAALTAETTRAKKAEQANATAAANAKKAATDHAARTDNPHAVTAAQVGAVPTTRTINGYTLDKDLDLYADDVGAYSTETADARFYPLAEGNVWASWWSGDGFRVSVTNYNVAVTAETAWERLPTAAFDYKPDGTNAAYTVVWNENIKWNRWFDIYAKDTASVASNLNDKADRAWGNYDSHTGGEAPEGYTWISSPRVALAGGLSWQKFVTTSGGIWVLTANGMSVEADGAGTTNAYFRISDETGKSLFEIVKGDRVLVGASAASIKTKNLSDGGIEVTIAYNVESTKHPTLYGAPTLAYVRETGWIKGGTDAAQWTEVWSGSSGAWQVVCTVPAAVNAASGNQYFFCAQYEQGSETYIKQTAPVKFEKIIVGGKTYSITVEAVNGKNLLVLTEVQE